ncbi:GNAT family N-acetyltransferase [Cellulosimicrobium marinum]|uniref:GNAT family N-acetyltransferase n=1 Tax=Cellulosimicrobium marinum TaxID=1638992 RepID=UPI001E337793|nr:GNAT family N-acetyltransferase [Cellulosimicrobium marinum]MCB7136097.1 GNAT family N-acetyltransferase [Cellulosimicrobium marinum]
MRVAFEDPTAPDVLALLQEHLDEMRATSPPESVHALDVDRLRVPGIAFVTARDADGTLLGCGALKQHADGLGELKSMRTAASARGRGVAATVLGFLLDDARRRGTTRVSLETGVEDLFAPARRLYERHGFVACAPFADYTDDPNSVFLTLTLTSGSGGPGGPGGPEGPEGPGGTDVRTAAAPGRA